MSHIALRTELIGRFGNQLFQYCAARSKAEREGVMLAAPPWIGEKLFQIPPASRTDQSVTAGVGYAQSQEFLTYSRRDVLNWLRLKPEIQAQLDSFVPSGEIVAHLRRGDYAGYGYPIVSKKSYFQAAEKFGFNPNDIVITHEGEPLMHPDFAEYPFLPDFYRLMRAKVLFRANSSFSYWASVLGEAMTFSPSIAGKLGGVESNCEFFWGNAQRLANLDFTTDLHLFHESQRYEYDLTPASYVIDAGGYKGDFAAEIQRRYNCYVHVIEPCELLAFHLSSRFKDNSNFTVVHGALGSSNRTDTLHIKGDMTGIYAEGTPEKIDVFDVAGTIANPQSGVVDLLKLNIEGMEYEVLERILETGIAARFKAIQCQFHTVAPDWMNRYKAIHEGLKKTHRLTFDAPFCWQNWEIRSSGKL